MQIFARQSHNIEQLMRARLAWLCGIWLINMRQATRNTPSCHSGPLLATPPYTHSGKIHPLSKLCLCFVSSSSAFARNENENEYPIADWAASWLLMIMLIPAFRNSVGRSSCVPNARHLSPHTCCVPLALRVSFDLTRVHRGVCVTLRIVWCSHSEIISDCFSYVSRRVECPRASTSSTSSDLTHIKV